MTPRTAALILAGGQSRRMGRDKALLSLPVGYADQPTLLERTCSIAQSCVAQTYVLTPWPERYGWLQTSAVTVLRETGLRETGLRETGLRETQSGAGPLVALAQGWRMIMDREQPCADSPDWLLVLACDLPALNAATLKTWCRQAATVGDDAIALLPRRNDRWEPLCGLYHHRCLPSLHEAIQTNIRSCQHWLANETVIPLSLSDSNMLRNCNTPAEWQQFLDSLSLKKP